MSPSTQRQRPRRHTLARHGMLRSPHPVTQLLKLIGVVAVVGLVSAAAVVGYLATDLTSTVVEGSVELDGQEEPPDLASIEGPVNLVIAGTDACEAEYAAIFGDRCTGPDSEAELNDVNLLVRIADNPRRVTVVTFPRDLEVPIPACTREDGTVSSAASGLPINVAYSMGGLPCVVNTLSELSGQNISYAAKITWGGVIELTDVIGGVEVCLAQGIRDRETGIDWPAGPRTIEGVEALQFLRTRYGVGDGSDLGRIANQQQYMSRLVRKIMSDEVLTDLPKLYRLANVAVQNITASEGLANPVTLAQIALAVKDVPFNEIVFVRYPVFDDPDNPGKLVPDYDSADALWAALDANQPLQLSSQYGDQAGVTVVDPQSTTEPAPAPTDSAVLPSNIYGNSVDQETCSNGNVR